MSLLVQDVINRAFRLNGAVASGLTPTANELTDAMTAFNTMKAAWFGTLIGGRITEQDVTASPAQAENGGEYAAPGGAFAIIAPAAPRSGARFGVVDGALSFATHNCTVSGNGRLIEGAIGSLILNTNGDNRRWWYRGDTGNWVREAPFASPTSAIEFPDALIAYMPYMLAVVLAPEFNTDLRQDVLAGNAEGRAAMARAYAPRGRNEVETPLGAGVPTAPAQGQG